MVALSLAPALREVSLAQFRALVLLSAVGPMRSGALARRLGIHQSTLTRTVDRLVVGGFVQRLQNPVNRREVILELTEPGASLVRAVTDRRYQQMSEILRRLPPRRRATVLAGMQAFAEAAGEPSIDVVAVLGG